MTKSAQQARETIIYFLQNGKVESDSLFNFVMESAEECTSPRGAMTKLFVEEHVEFVAIDEDHPDYVTGEVEQEEVWKWGLFLWAGGQKRTLVQAYDTKEEAMDEWYTRTYNYDFMTDDQRDTMYFTTPEEAEKELNERING